MGPRSTVPTASWQAALTYLRERGRSHAFIDTMASCLFLARYLGGEHGDRLAELLTWLRSDSGPLSPERLVIIRGSFPANRGAPETWAAREELPPPLDAALGPFYELDASVRALAGVIDRLERAVRGFDRIPLLARLMRRHGLLGRAVALLDLSAEALGEPPLTPMEMAAVAVLSGFEAPTDVRWEADSRAKAWMDRRRSGGPAVEELRPLFRSTSSRVTSAGAATRAPSAARTETPSGNETSGDANSGGENER